MLMYLIPWLILSSVLLLFTLQRPHPYRFSRFLAFESLLSLVFLNARNWFVNPLSFLQITSWFLLMGSLALAIQGFATLKNKGNPKGDFEDTTQLIKTGVYRYIRHPLYASLILFGLGGFLKNPSLLGGGLLLFHFWSVLLTAKIEERHNLERFGDEYRQYIQTTKRFIPYIY
jgi:protein-S-isoprenylcysteine O-methyltransferase Ste14